MKTASLKERALELAQRCGIARGRDFDAAGITRATVKRFHDEGQLQRVGRGLYKLTDAPVGANSSLAEAARIQPRGIICLLSALAKTHRRKSRRYSATFSRSTLRATE